MIKVLKKLFTHWKLCRVAPTCIARPPTQSFFVLNGTRSFELLYNKARHEYSHGQLENECADFAIHFIVLERWTQCCKATSWVFFQTMKQTMTLRLCRLNYIYSIYIISLFYLNGLMHIMNSFMGNIGQYRWFLKVSFSFQHQKM